MEKDVLQKSLEGDHHDLLVLSMATNSSNTAVKRFSGEGLTAVEDYRRWRKWARAYLKMQAAKGVSPDAFGSILYTLLDGQALLAVDGVDPDDLEQDGGEHLVFDKLDDQNFEEFRGGLEGSAPASKAVGLGGQWR